MLDTLEDAENSRSKTLEEINGLLSYQTQNQDTLGTVEYRKLNSAYPARRAPLPDESPDPFDESVLDNPK